MNQANTFFAAQAKANVEIKARVPDPEARALMADLDVRDEDLIDRAYVDLLREGS